MSETGIYHVMIRGVNRQMIFEDAEDYCKFLKLLKITKEKSEFKLFGYCLLGNHAYLLIREMDGRLFVQFIALILISAIRKKNEGFCLIS